MSNCSLSLNKQTGFGVLEQLDNYWKIEMEGGEKNLTGLIISSKYQHGSMQSGRDHKLLKAAEPWAAAWELATVSLFNALFWFPGVGEERGKKSVSGWEKWIHIFTIKVVNPPESGDVLSCTPSACRHTPSKLVASGEQLCFICVIRFNVRTKKTKKLGFASFL